MATIYKLNNLGIKFQVKLTDCIGGDTDTSDITDQLIVFRKPDGVRFEKPATLEADPENPSQVIPISNIVGNGIDGIVTVTIPDTTLLKDGEIVSISGTTNFDVSNVPLSIINGTTFTYNLGSVGSTTPETVGTATTQGESLITYINGSEGTPPETESILDLRDNWEYSGKIKLTNNDSFETSSAFVFWVN